MLIPRRLLAAVVVASVCGLALHAAPAPPSDAFEQITYRDSGGFGAGGRILLTVTGTGNLEVQILSGHPRVRTLQGEELAELHAAVAAGPEQK